MCSKKESNVIEAESYLRLVLEGLWRGDIRAKI